MTHPTTTPRQVSFQLKAHDPHSLEVILWYMFAVFIETCKLDQAKVSDPWVAMIKQNIAELCALFHEQNESEFWHRFRNVTAGFRALEGALNDSRKGFVARVSFDPPSNRTFNVSIRDQLTGRFFEATIRPKHFETVDLRCCVFENPIDKMDSLRGDAEHLRVSGEHIGSPTNVEILELDAGWHVNDGFT